MRRFELSAVSITFDTLFFQNVCPVLLMHNGDIDGLRQLANIPKVILSGSFREIDLLDDVFKINLNICSVDLEGHISPFWENLYMEQYRYCQYLENIAEDENLFHFQKLNSKYKVVVIYVTKRSIPFFGQLHQMITNFRKEGFFVSINMLPSSFVYANLRLPKDKYRELANITSSAIESFGNLVYGDFPVYNATPGNLQGCCPCSMFMLNIYPHGVVTPCRFSNIQLGIIQDGITEIWNSFNRNIEAQEYKCNHFEMCRGGCYGNRNSLDECDNYCGG